MAWLNGIEYAGPGFTPIWPRAVATPRRRTWGHHQEIDMDPTAVLTQLQEAVWQVQRHDDSADPDALKVCDLFDMLNDHLTRGGSLPAAWSRSPRNADGAPSVTDRESAVAFVRWCLKVIGVGYHPDTHFREYADARSDGHNSTVFSTAEVKGLEEKANKAFDILQGNMYAVALDELKKMYPDHDEGE